LLIAVKNIILLLVDCRLLYTSKCCSS